MCKMQAHFTAIKNILNTLNQLKIFGQKFINAMMNEMGMNNSIHNSIHIGISRNIDSS